MPFGIPNGGCMYRDKLHSQYHEQDPTHYYNAFIKGNPVQRFWHREKFLKTVRAARLKPGEKILDAGCGSGTLLLFLPESVDITVADISAKNVAFAKKAHAGIKGIVGSIEKTKLGKDRYDAIFFIAVLEHIRPEDEQHVLKSLHAALKPGGRLILTTPNYRSMWPVIEKVWNRMNPIDYACQHINRKHPAGMKRSLLHAGFRPVHVSTFFFLSPFLAFSSASVARLFMRVEEAAVPFAGSLIITRAEKPKKK
jgi:2-polyprenyl-3-methyl-5-hydroxy-6-metoxy-1,4-benzoquinol methylase